MWQKYIKLCSFIPTQLQRDLIHYLSVENVNEHSAETLTNFRNVLNILKYLMKHLCLLNARISKLL